MIARMALDVPPVGELERIHRGPVIGPMDRRFDSARKTFNALTDRNPLVVVRPVDTADVVAAIRFAADHGLPVSVRGGGHSVAGHSVGQGSLMVDLRLLREVSVDPSARTATVQGGACWYDVDARTQGFELAMPGGTYGDTGVGGLTLTGGIGHLTGLYGMTLDNLVEAELVTASGSVVRAGHANEPELFWAIRGGGGNFGVVTEFVFDVHPLVVVTGGLLVHRLEDAPAVLRAFADMMRQAPDELTCMPQLMPTALAGDPGQALVTSVAFAGSPADAETAIRPLLESAEPILRTVGPMVYQQLQGMYEAMPFGLRNYWTGRFVQQLPDDLLRALVDHHATSPAESFNAMLFEPFHGAAARVGRLETAFGHRDARFNVTAFTVWEDESLDDYELQWAATAREMLTPFSTGGYLNYATDDAPETVSGAFGAEIFERLQAAKTAWDPENVFRFNHNIPPHAA
jgi:FAD/FMN-containing dehydrogenase